HIQRVAATLASPLGALICPRNFWTGSVLPARSAQRDLQVKGRPPLRERKKGRRQKPTPHCISEAAGEVRGSSKATAIEASKWGRSGQTPTKRHRFQYCMH